MKILGWFLLIISILNFVAVLVAAANGEAEYAARSFGGFVTLGLLGVYLLHRAKQKESEQTEREKWINGKQDSEE